MFTSSEPRPAPKRGVMITVLFLAGALFGAAGGPVHADPSGLACIPHPAIRITEDHGPQGYTWTQPLGGQAAYRPGSGVIGGSGTEADPYLIEGWCITPLLGDPSSAGIHISGTTAHARIVSVVYASPGVTAGGVLLEDAHNVTVADSRFTLGAFGVLIAGSASGNVIADNTLERNVVGVGLSGGPTTEVQHNVVVGNGILSPLEGGVALQNASRNTVAQNSVDGSGGPGIRLVSATENLVHDNAVTEPDQHAILLESSHDNHVAQNDLHGGDGVVFQSSDRNVFEDNSVRGTYGDGVRVYDGHGNAVVGNLVDGTLDQGIHLLRGAGNRVGGNTLLNMSAEALQIQDSPDAHIHDNVVTAVSREAMVVRGSPSTRVEGNIIVSEETGIKIWDSPGSLLHGNHLSCDWFGDGIVVQQPGGVTMSNNTVTGYRYAIQLFVGPENIVAGNHLVNNTVGMDIFASPDNRIHGNLIADNADNGVTLWQFSDRNEFTHNTITRNGREGAQELSLTKDNRFADNNVTHNKANGFRIESAAVEHNIIAWNGRDGIFGGWGATGNAIHNNTRHGVVGYGLGARNNIADNGGSGLHLDITHGARGADGNWWGHPTGPSGGISDPCWAETADGQGQAITTEGAAACFSPWRDAPYPDAGPRS